MAKEYPVSENSIRDIRKGRSWGHLDRSDAPTYRDNRKRITVSEAEEIINDPSSHSKIADKYNISVVTVFNIRNGDTWRHLNREDKPHYEGERK